MKLKIDPKKHPKNWLPRWLEYRMLLLVVLVVVLVIAMSISEPVPQMEGFIPTTPRLSASTAATATPAANLTASPEQPGAVQATRTATPVPAEWYTNRDMANGIVLGAVALVLIIVGGTLSVIRKKPGY